VCVRIGSYTSKTRNINNGVPQGAVISPLLFNIMLFDFLMPPTNVNRLLFAYDITLYAQVKHPMDAEPILQPYIDKVVKWGRKWKFKFSAPKSSAVSFTRLYKPGNDPLLFLRGQRIPNAAKAKFLGIIFDAKLLWKDHIEMLVNKCTRIKNAFSIIAKASYALSHKNLCVLFKSLVRSRIDYGLIAYGSSRKFNIQKLEVVIRSILRIILGSRFSIPTEILYADTDSEPIPDRRDWLGIRYLININQHPDNLTYATARKIFNAPDKWPPRCYPSLSKASVILRGANISLFKLSPGSTDQLTKVPPPWFVPPYSAKWFPLRKSEASANLDTVRDLFENLLSIIPPTDITAYTDGSTTSNPSNSYCAYYIPEMNFCGSWRLTPGSSIFSAELQGILKVLQEIYQYDSSPPHIHIFSDSRSAIKALLSPNPTKNRCVNEIRNLLDCLKSSGTNTTLYWIPSHCGIPGNEKANTLASDEAKSSSGNTI
jgi:ribonuclease HI